MLRIGTTDPNDVQQTLDLLRNAGQVIRRVQLIRPTLEELFIDTVAAPPESARVTPPAFPVTPQPHRQA